MSLTVDVNLGVTATLTATNDLGTPTHKIPYSFTDSLASGTGLDQADQVWVDDRSLGSSTSEDLDLAGVLTNGLGQTVTFVKIKCILIENRTTTAGYKIAVGGASATQFINWVANSSDIVNIGPGGVFFLYTPDAAGYGVIAATGDLLKINNANAGGVTYRILLIGTTA